MSSFHRNKRQKLDTVNDTADPALIRQQRAAFLSSMSRAVSPPPSVRTKSEKQPAVSFASPEALSILNIPKNNDSGLGPENGASVIQSTQNDLTSTSNFLTSPFKLTRIRDLPSKDNQDTVSLHDILGNPLIKEAWIFNFCFDIDWTMQHFDADVRDMVQVKVIHGSWKNEDVNRINIVEACKRWKNVEANTAYLPDPFGTHHSKMFFLFTHDDKAEVIIHTANMLAKDWTNMTQAVWRSGPLEKLDKKGEVPPGLIGSGTRFKQDLLVYLRAYRKPTQSLCKQLQEYDFSPIRGALVASVPAKIKESQKTSTITDHLWGYPQLGEVVTALHNDQKHLSMLDQAKKPHLVCQVSSIASLPAGWLHNLCKIALNNPNASSEDTSILYPTPKNVSKSLDGYMAGGSIHTKAQSNAHLQQISSMRQQLCQWTEGPTSKGRAGRHLAAPHIKTYIKFKERPSKDTPCPEIEWALLTSANLSKQAWGTFSKPTKAKKDQSEATVQISSFEIGVMVWPELFTSSFDQICKGEQAHDKSQARMVSVFGKDLPSQSDAHNVSDQGDETIVGLRMPYDLPLTPYGTNELPWSPQSQYNTPDSHGNTWPPTGW